MSRLCKSWDETITWWKSQKCEWYAGYGTAIYIGAIILVMAAKLDELFALKLNELGDFLAGAFGPIAFLWLVLGFLQQGRELKLSSDALQLQAAELKNSVDQQKEMVGIAGRELEAELEKIIYERELRLKALLPKFKLSAAVPMAGDFLSVDFRVENFGSLAENVRGIINESELFKVAALSAGKPFSLKAQLARKDASYNFRLEYEYGDGIEATDTYSLKVSVSNAGGAIAQIYFVLVR